MKMMGKIIDKMMGDTDKEAYEEMMPALTIKIATDGTATVTKDEEMEEEENTSGEMLKTLQDRSPQDIEE